MLPVLPFFLWLYHRLFLKDEWSPHLIFLSFISLYLFPKFFPFSLYFLTSQPIIESLIRRSLPATHHEEVCDYSSSVGNSRSHYITISSSFTDAFLPSSLHSTINRLALRRLCYRRCLIAGTFPNEAIIVASQCLSKSKMLSSSFAIGSSSSRFLSFLRTSTSLCLKTAPS